MIKQNSIKKRTEKHNRVDIPCPQIITFSIPLCKWHNLNNRRDFGTRDLITFESVHGRTVACLLIHGMRGMQLIANSTSKTRYIFHVRKTLTRVYLTAI